MKQLIETEARHLQNEDLIFDFKHRDLQKIEYVACENKGGENIKHALDTTAVNVHISYGEKAMSADNMKPDAKVLILIDTEKLRVLEPDEIGYR